MRKLRIPLLLLTTIYIPIFIHHNSHNPRKGVALAHGWHNGPKGVDDLRVGTYKLWWPSYPPPYRNATMLPTFWAECWPVSSGCNYEDSIWPDYLDFIGAEKSSRDYLVIDGRFAVNFFNECDLPFPQCAQPPAHMAEVYLDMIAACGNCLFFGPAVSSKDANCNWKPEETLDFHKDIAHHGKWCYVNEFWERVELAANARGMDGASLAADGRKRCSVHDYARHPGIGSGSDEESPVASIKRLGCEMVIVSEYSACDKGEIERLTNLYNDDPAIVAFYAWTANLPNNSQGVAPCEVLLDWDTGNLTPLGRAFANAGN